MDTCHAHPTAWAKLEGQHAPRLPARSAHGTPRPRTCRHRQSRHCRLQAAAVPSTSSQHVCPAEEAEHNQSHVPGPESEGRGKLGLLQQRGVIAHADKASRLPAWHQAGMLTSIPLQAADGPADCVCHLEAHWCAHTASAGHACGRVGCSSWWFWEPTQHTKATMQTLAAAATDAQQNLPFHARDLCPSRTLPLRHSLQRCA